VLLDGQSLKVAAGPRTAEAMVFDSDSRKELARLKFEMGCMLLVDDLLRACLEFLDACIAGRGGECLAPLATSVRLGAKRVLIRTQQTEGLGSEAVEWFGRLSALAEGLASLVDREFSESEMKDGFTFEYRGMPRRLSARRQRKVCRGLRAKAESKIIELRSAMRELRGSA
jgi:hypothetical protein